MSLFGDILPILNDLADNVLQVEVNVTHQAIIAQDLFGKPTYSTTTHRAIVVLGRKQVYAEGKLVEAKASITFLQPLPDTTPIAPFTRENPIDPNDILTLPDGSTGPIIKGAGLLDGETGKTMYYELFLGSE